MKKLLLDGNEGFWSYMQSRVTETEPEFYRQDTLPGAVAQPISMPHPTNIGPYKIESLLSQGGMSLLYLASHPKSEKPLAIKVLSPTLVSQTHMKKRFLKEAKIIALTDHPNIVKLHGQGEWENGLYIAMEFIQGISLRQFIDQHSLSHKRALEIILKVAYALLHLHTHGVIHRDLKPENILITEDSEVKVIDFGIALFGMDSEKKPKSGSGGMIGTPSYMSPEQKSDPSSVTYASDIFSLGVIAYELVVGKLSYGYIDLEALQVSFRPILEKTLAKSPKDRYADIVDVITDITSYLKSEQFEEEAMHCEEMHHVWESFASIQDTMLPEYPKSPNLDLFVAKPQNISWPGFFQDHFTFADLSELYLLGKSTDGSPKAMIYVALLKGMMEVLLKKYEGEGEQSFEPLSFISKLNNLLCENALDIQFSLNILYLDRAKDDFYFISCGDSPLWHILNDSDIPRLHICSNPLLGAVAQHEFVEVTDNWHEGDAIAIHSQLDATYTPEQENALRHLIQEQAQSSSKSTAQAVLSYFNQTYPNKPHFFSFCVTRIT